MAERQSLGPVRIFNPTTLEINRALIELSERIDSLKGLRGRAEVWDRMRVEDPTETKDALNRGGGVLVIDKHITSTMTNTLTETTLYSHTLPANTLGSLSALRLTVIGFLFHNDPAALTFTVRTKFGATTIGTMTVASLAGAPNNRPVRVIADLHVTGPFNFEASLSEMILGDPSTDGATSTVAAHRVSFHDSIRGDLATPLAFALTGQFSIASSAVTFRVTSVRLEHLP